MKQITEKEIQELMNTLIAENIHVQAYLAIQQMFEKLPAVLNQNVEDKSSKNK